MRQPLLEREAELATLARRLERLAAAGEGGAVVIEGVAGIGKSALLAQLRAEAAATGAVRVLSARGTELELELAFGGVRQLLAPCLMALEEPERERVLAGPARLALPTLGMAAPPADTAASLADPLYGLYWLCANLADLGPLLVAVDDLHWLDDESSRFVAYLALRLEGLPVLLVAGAVPSDANTALQALRAVAATVRPEPLSAASVGTLLGDAADAGDAHRVTGGNPFLVVELARAIERAAPVAALDDVASEAVARFVARRVERISGDAVALAQAVALFPAGAMLADAAQVAGLEARAAAAAADALTDAHVLSADGALLQFLHPLLRSSLYQRLGRFARSHGHAAAARALKARGAATEDIAAQLLAGEPAADPESVRILRAAAAEAAARSAPRAAARYMERALAEGAAPDEERPRMLLELGRWRRLTDRRAAQATLAQAFTAAHGSPAAAEAAIELAVCALGNMDHATVRHTVAAVTGTDLAPDDRLALDVVLHESLWAQEDAAGATAVLDRVPRDLPGETPAQRLALVELASARMLRGDPLEDVVELLVRAVGDRGSAALIAGTDLGDPLGYLILCGALDEAQAFAEERQELARETGNEALFAATQNTLGWVALMRGALPASEDAFRLGLERPALAPDMRALMTINLAETLIWRGAFGEAAAQLDALAATSPDALRLMWIQALRAEMATWQGDWAAAVDALERRRAFESETGGRHPNALYWLSDYADCLSGIGRGEEAIALMRGLVARSDATGGTLAAGVHRLTLGRLTGDVAMLERALAILEPSPYRWHAARVRLDLGAALRRRGERVAAREHLRVALDYSERNRVLHFAARAREELRLSGARPRRLLLTGVDALTPGELRIARLAADGQTNSQIAQRLFVTGKTVETQLSRVYRKLEIASRRELPAALADAVADQAA